ncbi:MAG: RHH-type proline utilization regulon transcriptional repressor/proline dehydrogenase, partial [Cellvibrionaceae bacterium]
MINNPIHKENENAYPAPASQNATVLAEKAIKLAAELHTNAQASQNKSEKAQAAQLSGMMADPIGKTMTMNLSDQAFRSHIPRRVNNQIRHLIDGYGVPSYLAWWERIAMEVGTQVGRVVPGMVVPMIVAKLRAETSSVIIPAEDGPLRKYLQSRKEMGTRLNLNYLGEA